MLRKIRFKNAKRIGGPRLNAIVRSIRDRGYLPTDPIIARIGQKGKWVIVDGGHRLTALKLLLKSFWGRLMGRKYGNVYFLLFETERSWAKMRQGGLKGARH
ncbi:MAG: ParB/RepB/Spo0J family partition protein [Neomegalonema sp.]|nr:ParB/RepB/Spo0J family partition protein [Neomegalonema sp.]